LTSEEYVQQVNRLMDLQNMYLQIFLGLIGILIAVAAFMQWRISKEHTNKLKREYDDKIEALEKRTKIINGSNSNGEWVRFSDGTQICRKSLPIGKTDEPFTDLQWNLPAHFHEDEFNVTCEIIGKHGNHKIRIEEVIKTNSSVVVIFETESYRLNRSSNLNLDFIAVGKWNQS